VGESWRTRPFYRELRLMWTIETRRCHLHLSITATMRRTCCGTWSSGPSSGPDGGSTSWSRHAPRPR